ncbi:hypothetical protein [Maricaulis sp.]|uniref:hypothetical protein n=1 Tax=Maricaulis sp. TaxID=1486257 RepID=UPI0025C3E19E|nr:hypothetical protein [Maricaulis sp.]
MFKNFVQLAFTITIGAVWIFLAGATAPEGTCDTAGNLVHCVILEVSAVPKLLTMLGIYAMAVLFFIITALRQNRPVGKGRRGRIRRYRHAEEFMVEKGRLSHEALIEYHREYKWEAYSGIALSAAMVVAALVIQGDATGAAPFADSELALWNAGILAIAGAMMAAAEIVHTNTLSPMVPIRTRLKVVGRSIVVAGMGVSLAVSSVFAFIGLAAPFIAILGTLIFFFLGLWLQSARSIPRDEMLEQFQLDEDEWNELVKRVDTGKRGD